MIVVASKLYEDGKLSARQAASIAGLSKRAFIELLGRYNVSVFSTSLVDLGACRTYAWLYLQSTVNELYIE